MEKDKLAEMTLKIRDKYYPVGKEEESIGEKMKTAAEILGISDALGYLQLSVALMDGDMKIICSLVDIITRAKACGEMAEKKYGRGNPTPVEIIEKDAGESTLFIAEKYGEEWNSRTAALLERILPALRSERSSAAIVDLCCLMIHAMHVEEKIEDKYLPAAMLSLEFD